jgi:hypothetical protein
VKRYYWVLFLGFSSLWGCQKDILLLGEETADSAKTMVFIRSITLTSFDTINYATGLSWDTGSILPSDSLDSIGPDIFFYFYHEDQTPPPYDTLALFTFSHDTHFQNVRSSDLPLQYILTNPVQVPNYYFNQTLYLRVADLDENTTLLNDTMIIDSIPFNFNQVNSDSTSITATGLHNSTVTLGLQWK